LDYTILFATSCIGLLVVTLVWLGLLYKPKRSTVPLLIGPVGTLSAAIPILGVWMPETFQAIWLVHQATFSFWLMSFVLIVLAVIFALVLQPPKRERTASIICGTLGFILNAAAFLAFMIYATVSPGGV